LRQNIAWKIACGLGLTMRACTSRCSPIGVPGCARRDGRI
jgi:hypothetical protein